MRQASPLRQFLMCARATMFPLAVMRSCPSSTRNISFVYLGTPFSLQGNNLAAVSGGGVAILYGAVAGAAAATAAATLAAASAPSVRLESCDISYNSISYSQVMATSAAMEAAAAVAARARLPGVGATGGGVAALGRLRVTARSCTIMGNNVAAADTASTTSIAGQQQQVPWVNGGGGLCAGGAVSLIVAACSLATNAVDLGAAGNASGGPAGAAVAAGGGGGVLAWGVGHVEVLASSVKAGQCGGGGCLGGGLHLAAAGQVALVQCDITGNTAGGGGGVYLSSQADGTGAAAVAAATPAGGAPQPATTAVLFGNWVGDNIATGYGVYAASDGSSGGDSGGGGAAPYSGYGGGLLLQGDRLAAAVVSGNLSHHNSLEAAAGGQGAAVAAALGCGGGGAGGGSADAASGDAATPQVWLSPVAASLGGTWAALRAHLAGSGGNSSSTGAGGRCSSLLLLSNVLLPTGRRVPSGPYLAPGPPSPSPAPAQAADGGGGAEAATVDAVWVADAAALVVGCSAAGNATAAAATGINVGGNTDGVGGVSYLPVLGGELGVAAALTAEEAELVAALQAAALSSLAGRGAGGSGAAGGESGVTLGLGLLGRCNSEGGSVWEAAGMHVQPGRASRRRLLVYMLVSNVHMFCCRPCLRCRWRGGRCAGAADGHLPPARQPAASGSLRTSYLGIQTTHTRTHTHICAHTQTHTQTHTHMHVTGSSAIAYMATWRGWAVGTCSSALIESAYLHTPHPTALHH